MLYFESVFFIEFRQDPFSCGDKVNADDPLLFQIGQASFQQSGADPALLIYWIHRKIVDLKAVL